MSSPLPIPILALGKYRDTAKAIGNVLAAHGFLMSGILTAQCYPSASLAVAHRVLERRPHTPLLGGDYSDAEASDAPAVLCEYTVEVGVFNGSVVVVRLGVVRRDGGATWVVEELKAQFESWAANEGFVDRLFAM